MSEVQTLDWFEENLSNLKQNLLSEERVLDAQMKRVVEMRQDITCLNNLISRAKARGKTTLPTNWREIQFKGRR